MEMMWPYYQMDSCLRHFYEITTPLLQCTFEQAANQSIYTYINGLLSDPNHESLLELAVSNKIASTSTGSLRRQA